MGVSSRQGSGGGGKQQAGLRRWGVSSRQGSGSGGKQQARLRRWGVSSRQGSSTFNLITTKGKERETGSTGVEELNIKCYGRKQPKESYETAYRGARTVKWGE